MRFPFHRFRPAVAIGLSLWLAVVACLIGCTLPTFADSRSIAATSIQENAADQTQSGLMANMENCPHHSSGNLPAKHGNNPARGGMSCCPVEVTVASKPDTTGQHIAPANDFILDSDFSSVTIRFQHSIDLLPRVWHSGRDTLLETHLLRI
jgi:hypothetical protein